MRSETGVLGDVCGKTQENRVAFCSVTTMTLSSLLPSSPMAIAKPFKKQQSQSLQGPMPSASSYLNALSQADARARNQISPARSPTSTPALSLSSSITSSSEDTVLNDDDTQFDNADGLALPARPPTSEQVFTTVHTEFGHCADQRYRYVSAHVPGTQIPAHVEHDPPYYILLSTYISYLILICLGHVRDFVGKRLSPSSYSHLMPKGVSLYFTYHTTLVLF
jgi:serine palmitoyltransferase